MLPDHSQFQKAQELIADCKKILLISHRRPDGDTLGATVALTLSFAALGKAVQPACIDPISNRLQFLTDLLPTGVIFVREFNLPDYDLIVISDAGASHMTGFQERYPDLLSLKIPLINIDHHASNEKFGTANLVDEKASSATVMVYRLLKYMNIPLSRGAACGILAGIYNDTGGLIHSNTTQETFEIAHACMQTGLHVEEIVRPMFRTASIPQLKLWGYLLENIRKNEKNIVSSVVAEGDLKTLGAVSGDTGGIIDLLSTIPNAYFTIMLAEEDGVVKGSLRTQRDDVNLSDIASQFGGGGHRKASGFRIQGRLQKEIVWRIVRA